MNDMPKYALLKKELATWIYAGRFQAGDRLPSEHELSRLFEISRQTVRQAIGELVQEGLLYRAQGKGTFFAGLPDRNAQERRPDSIPTVGVLTTYISDYIFPLIVRGAEAVLRSRGYRMLLFSTDNDKNKERECLETLVSQPLSGLIIEPTKSAEGNPNLPYYLSLEAQGIPYVMINERYAELDCPCIRLDDTKGGYDVAAHLIAAGHTRIAGFFKTDDLQGVNRLKGFLRALRDHKLPAPPEAVVKYTTEDTARPLAEAARLLSQPERPTAFVCYNDQLAVRLLEVVRQSGLKIPDDLAITGFDDSFLATATEVKLTSVKHPKIEMGRQAAEWLLERIEHGDRARSEGVVVIEPEVVVRSSSE